MFYIQASAQSSGGYNRGLYPHIAVADNAVEFCSNFNFKCISNNAELILITITPFAQIYRRFYFVIQFNEALLYFYTRKIRSYFFFISIELIRLVDIVTFRSAQFYYNISFGKINPITKDIIAIFTNHTLLRSSLYIFDYRASKHISKIRTISVQI